MKILGIDLQEGFESESVVMELDGREVYRQKNVTTKLLLGYAQTLTFQVPEGNVRLRISLPLRSLEKIVRLNISADTYVGVSLTLEGLETILSGSPFYYQ